MISDHETHKTPRDYVGPAMCGPVMIEIGEAGHDIELAAMNEIVRIISVFKPESRDRILNYVRARVADEATLPNK